MSPVSLYYQLGFSTFIGFERTQNIFERHSTILRFFHFFFALIMLFLTCRPQATQHQITQVILIFLQLKMSKKSPYCRIMHIINRHRRRPSKSTTHTHQCYSVIGNGDAQTFIDPTVPNQLGESKRLMWHNFFSSYC